MFPQPVMLHNCVGEGGGDPNVLQEFIIPAAPCVGDQK